MNLLLVEDDQMLGEAICDGARHSGWHIEHVGDASSARSALVDHGYAAELARHSGWHIEHVGDASSARSALVDHGYAAVLLDIGLPGDSGLTVLRAMRSRYDATPVLILTARGQLSERIAGLDAGADDYLVKPFQFDELWARVRSVIRRSQGRVVPVFTYGDVRIDRSRRVVTKAGTEVVLSAHEYRTLLALVERPGHVVTRDDLHDIVYGTSSNVESNTIAVFIHQVRRKLGDDMIRTVHGLGYVVGQPAA